MLPQGITQEKWVKQPWPGCCVCWEAPRPRKTEVIGLQEEGTLAQKLRMHSDYLVLLIYFHVTLGK